MSLRILAVGLGLLAASGFSTSVSAQQETETTRSEPQETTTKDKPAAKTPAKPKSTKATFGGGCFWCTEAVFEQLPGVKSVVSGYAGGSVPNPTYQMVCSGLTGHAEVVQIEFDPKVISYEKLLQVFWDSHDPTTLNAQGPDVGTNYRSIILYSDEDQKAAAIKSYQEEKTNKKYKKRRIVTELVPLTAFYPAEDYHQNYFMNHRGEEYSNAHIEPKLMELRRFEQLRERKLREQKSEKAPQPSR